MDLIIGLVIFLIGIVVFMIYSINYSGESEEIFSSLTYDGEIIMNEILSEGHPENWNTTNVIKIGILSNEKINQTKLEKFYNLSQTNYQTTKEIFNTPYEYYLFLEKPLSINEGTKEGIGKPGTTKDSIDSTNLIKITRFTIYQNKPVTAYLYVWEEA